MWTNPGADILESAHGLTGLWLLLGILFNVISGILMTMGLSPAVAMPVMMLDAAMIMLVLAW